MNTGGRDMWDTAVTLSARAQQYHTVPSITTPYQGNPLELTMFVPCRNREAEISAIFDTIADAMQVVDKSYEIIVIDDGSRDASVRHVRDYIAAHPQRAVTLCANASPRGLARNYLDAAFIGRGNYFCMIDGADSVETLVDVLKNLGEADIIVPYAVSEKNDRPPAERLRIRLFNLASGHAMNSYDGMQVHLRYNVMRWHPDSTGEDFQPRLLCRLLDLGFTCKQAPCRGRLGQAHGPMTWKRWLSVLYTAAGIAWRRLFPSGTLMH